MPRPIAVTSSATRLNITGVSARSTTTCSDPTDAAYPPSGVIPERSRKQGALLQLVRPPRIRRPVRVVSRKRQKPATCRMRRSHKRIDDVRATRSVPSLPSRAPRPGWPHRAATWRVQPDSETRRRFTSLEDLPGFAGAFKCIAAAIYKRESRTGDQIFHGLGDEHFGRFGQRCDSSTDAYRDSADFSRRRGDLTGVDARAHLEVERSQSLDDRLRASHAACRTVEDGKKAV